jgi:uncharacterized membrane protein YwzB
MYITTLNNQALRLKLNSIDTSLFIKKNLYSRQASVVIMLFTCILEVHCSKLDQVS